MEQSSATKEFLLKMLIKLSFLLLLRWVRVAGIHGNLTTCTGRNKNQKPAHTNNSKQFLKKIMQSPFEDFFKVFKPVF